MIGTIPLFIPNTGIYTKLCSLKYTPNTVAAAGSYAFSIIFIPNVSTDTRALIIIEGIPTAYIVFIVPKLRMNLLNTSLNSLLWK